MRFFPPSFLSLGVLLRPEEPALIVCLVFRYTVTESVLHFKSENFPFSFFGDYQISRGGAELPTFCFVLFPPYFFFLSLLRVFICGKKNNIFSPFSGSPQNEKSNINQGTQKGEAS